MTGSVDNFRKFELSVSQKEFWTFRRERHVPFSQMVLRLRGGFDGKDWTRTFSRILERHPILRSRCVPARDSIFPWQTEAVGEISLIDAGTVAGGYDEVKERAETCLASAYDVCADIPVRCCSCRDAGGRQFLFIRLFALWSDAYSCAILYREFADACRPEQTPQSQPIGYHDFAQWQNELLNEPEEEAVRFWEKLDLPPVENIFPFGRRTNPRFSPGRTVLGRLGINRQADPRLLFFSRFVSWLGQFVEGDLTVGYIPFRRNYEELNATVGLIARPLPVRIEAAKLPDAGERVSTAGEALDKVLSWQDYFPLVPELRDKDRLPAYLQYCFEYVEWRAAVGDQPAEPDLILYDLYSDTIPYLLKLFCVDRGDELELHLCYDTGTFDPIEASELAAQLRSYLGIEPTVLALFEEQVRQTPGNTAVSYGNAMLTYAQLDHQAGLLAGRLRKDYGVTGNQLVAVWMHRSPGLIAAILGVLKSGAAYVPIDPDAPVERVRYILRDCGPGVLITGRESIDAITASLTRHVLYLEAVGNETEGIPFSVSAEENADRPAYVIYTSGSTGNPKGCMISHRNLYNYIQWANEYYFGWNDHGNWGLMTSISFDLTVTSLYTSLTRGRNLIIPAINGETADLLKSVFADPSIDTLKLTPAHLSLLRGAGITGTNVRLIICGGEQLTWEQLAAVWDIDPAIHIFNEYGPTETTVGCVVKEMLPEDERILIGVPGGNVSIHILDDGGKETPAGVKGEIFIGGAGVGMGYLNRPELTSRRFTTAGPGGRERRYATGDLGRWLPSGDIEYLGRTDEQVKIRGYRVEPGEIAARLNAHPSILETVVLSHEAQDGRFLAAYYVPKEPVAANVLREYLQLHLPEYMIPTWFVRVDRMPLTPNGKIDRSALAKRPFGRSADYQPPVTATECKLQHLLEEILKVDGSAIGAGDDFLSLGLHSIRAIHLIQRIQQDMSVRVGLNQIFGFPSIRKLAVHLDEKGSGPVSERFPKCEKSEFYPLSSAQERLFYEHETNKTSLTSNISFVYEVRGAVDPEKIKEVLDHLLARHETLRTCFFMKAGEVVQKIVPAVEIDISLLHWQGYPDIAAAFRAFVRPFDLSRTPLIRCGLFNDREEKVFLLFDVHHIACDGVSLNLLMNEFKALYNDRELSATDVRYIDFVFWQKHGRQLIDAQRTFWARELAGFQGQLDLPTLQDRADILPGRAQKEVLTIEAPMRERIKKMGVEANATEFMILLSVYYLLLHRLSGNTDIIIGTDAIGRIQPELKSVVGTFVNVLPLRIGLDAGEDYLSFLGRVRQTVLDAFENQEFPFDEMSPLLEKGRKGRLVDVYFAYDGFFDTGEDPGILDFIPCPIEKEEMSTRYELELDVYERKDRLDIGMTYGTALYQQDTIRLFLEYYSCLLVGVLAHPGLAIGEVPMDNRSQIETICAGSADS